MKHKLLVLAIAASLAACGGGGGSSKSNPPSGGDGGDNGGGSPVTQTGVFIDSPVAGISYRTESKSGVTSALGEYEYVEGETVTFFIGDLVFPAVAASGVVTPADIAAGNGVAQTNMLQILQTLDNDGNPSNGIQIQLDASVVFQGVTLDITAETFDDEAEAILGRQLVSEGAANAHFDASLQQQLLGSWVYSEGPGKRNVLSFLATGHYVIIHEHDDEPGDPDSQKAGSVEYGVYLWDTEDGTFFNTLVAESDGWGGLYDEGSSVSKLRVDGTTLTLTMEGDDEVQFTRVASTTNPLVGAWLLFESKDDNHNILTVLSDSEYVIAHTNNQEPYVGEDPQPLSGEFGTYSLVNGNFQTLGASVDTDGPGGLYNAEDPSDQDSETMQIMPWGDLRFGDMNEGTYSFMRLGSFAATLQDFNADGELATIQATRDFPGFFPTTEQLKGSTFRVAVDFADDTESAFQFAFSNDYPIDPNADIETGTVTVMEVGEDQSFVGEWSINSAGAVAVTFNDGDIDIEMTIAKVQGDTGTALARVLLSLQSTEGEDSLWESKLEPFPVPD